MRALIVALTTAAATALLGACAAPAVLSQTSYDTQFRSGVISEFSYAGGGGMLVTIAGNPFPQVANDAFDADVVERMQGLNRGALVRFSATPTATMIPGYRVVMLFDSAAVGNPAQLCRQDVDGGGGGQSGRLWLTTVFCGDTDARSWVRASVPSVSGVDDPLFRRLVAQSTFQMLPPRDDEAARGDYD